MKYCFLLLLLLGACTPSPTEMPPYLVMVTTVQPNTYGRCTGIALDEWTILVPNHCAHLMRIETQYGQSSLVYPLYRWPDIDTALLESFTPILLPEYANLTEANPTLPASLFGVCPQHFSHVPRPISFEKADWYNQDDIPCEKWIVQTSSCGGDSGALILQDGQVVGMGIAVASWWIDNVEGREVCVIPTHAIMEKLSWQTASNN